MAFSGPKLTVVVLQSGGLGLVLDHQLHVNYGVAYPVTYMVGVPGGSSNLQAYRRHSVLESWSRVPEKTTSDFFNGQEAVRFDYVANIAFTSVAFGANTDSLFVLITDQTGQPINITYHGIPLYYDNRQAAAVITADDYNNYGISAFAAALSVFRSHSLWTTVGIITGPSWSGTPLWTNAQLQLDSGYVEAGSHSRSHLNLPYPDPASEVGGSKSDILNNLQLPPLFRNGSTQYVYSWIAPYGQYTQTIAAVAAQNLYLDCRTVARYVTTGYTAWNSALPMYTETDPSASIGPGYTTDLAALNAAFDQSLSAGAIYKLMVHPGDMIAEWSKPYASGHMQYISGRTNVWYAALGHIYVYHLVADPAVGSILQLPSVATTAATDIGQSSATLHGMINPQGSSVTYHFEYGLTASYGISTGSGLLSAGTSSIAVDASVSGLTPGTTYHYRIVASEDTSGAVFGDDRTFTTVLPLPVVTTATASAITATSAILNGSVNPNGFAATYHFEYGPTTSYGAQTTTGNLPVGSDEVNVSASLAALTPGATVHYRLVANNGTGGNIAGADQIFTTLSAPPSVATLPAGSVTTTAAVLHGTINPHGSSTTYHFLYGPTIGYGASTTTGNIVAGSNPVTIDGAIGGLLPGTQYHFTLVANNGVGGDVTGSDLTLTTEIPPPTVTTTSATNVRRTAATLNGTINPNGFATSYHFEYGPTAGYGMSSSPQQLSAGSTAVGVHLPVADLIPGGVYHYRLVADNGSGASVSGGDQTCVTAYWSVVTTGTSHTIIIPRVSNPAINGRLLSAGDCIGVFYDSSGTLVCAGCETWTGGTDITVTAFGDDQLTPAPDGFGSGELLHWKIYRSSDATVYDAVAGYVPPGGIVISEDRFVPNGISELASLVCGSPTLFHAIALRQGWGLISSYVDPSVSVLDSLFKPVIADLIIAKNALGKSFIPSIPVNTIGPWSSAEGYQIKMSNAGLVEFTGLGIVPETTPLTVPAGWSILPYLRTASAAVEVTLTSIASSIIIVKDQDGKSYIPSIPVNTIGSLQPGQGYQIKLSASQTFSYGPNTAPLAKSTGDAPSTLNGSGPPRHFHQPSSTGRNATLVFKADVLKDRLQPGDEIAAFTRQGMIAGAEVYAGGNLAMVVWGDDPTTKEVDGLQTGEQWELRIWKNSSGAEAGFSGISWPSRSGTYETDAIIVADRVQTDVRETVAPDGIVAQNYPNPFNLSTTIQFSLPKAGHVHVQVFNTLGEMILPILDDDLEEGLHTIQCNGSSLASGLYYYKIECGSFVAIRKMVLAK